MGEPIVRCGICGEPETLVRPGKYQCDNEDCGKISKEEQKQLLIELMRLDEESGMYDEQT